MKFTGTEVLALIVTFKICFVAEGARILAVLPLYARSHHRFSQPLLKALARAGHDVVVYSPFPLEQPVPNYSHVPLLPVLNETEMNEDLNRRVNEASAVPHHKCVDLLVNTWEGVFNDFIANTHIQKLFTSKENFDLLITEAFINQEFVLILGNVLKVPVISIQSCVTNSLVNSITGNALSIAHIPDHCSPFSDKMSFFERFRNTFHVFRNLYYVYYGQYLPSLDQRIKKYFPDAPPVLEMMNNVSLVFVNDHLTADYARPRTPNIIPVAGIHIEDANLLPKALQKFMDEATDGVILFSLGTYVPDDLQPQEYFDMYNNVFRQLKQRVLWKTKKENIQGLPDNVMAVKWAPQRDILAHPKCVLFITHTGLLSQHEAIHCAVPVVTIPHFYDQYRNGKLFEDKGVGVRLIKEELTESTVLSAIRTVLDDPQYKTNVKRLSSIFRDRPMTPAETVVYWTEYVLRHGGAHLRPASIQLSWYQLVLLDVLAVILATFVSLAVAVYIIFRQILRFFSIRRASSKIKEKCN